MLLMYTPSGKFRMLCEIIYDDVGLKVWAVAGIDWKHGKHTSSDC